jgi:hypothetical protein
VAVILRTHGGLGNQLFQILYARLYSGAIAQPYFEIHDENYAHKFSRSVEIADNGSPTRLRQRLISTARFPKLRTKSRFCPTEKVRILGDVYLDGYFQDFKDYQAFPDAMIAQEVARFRIELKINPQASSNAEKLYHLRLGDFFDDRKKAVEHAITRMETFDANCTIITNQEDIFEDERIADYLKSRGCHLHSTRDFAPEDVIRLMSRFGSIYTNNSTLALWASVLGNSITTFDDKRLSALHMRMFNAVNGPS